MARLTHDGKSIYKIPSTFVDYLRTFYYEGKSTFVPYKITCSRSVAREAHYLHNICVFDR